MEYALLSSLIAVVGIVGYRSFWYGQKSPNRGFCLTIDYLGGVGGESVNWVYDSTLKRWTCKKDISESVVF